MSPAGRFHDELIGAMVDGTFLGPHAMAEPVAMHLHRLGAARAASITFVADGAPWIWERLPTIVRLAKLEGVPIREVLDRIAPISDT